MECRWGRWRSEWVGTTGGGMRVVEMPGLQGGGGQRGLGMQGTELGRKEGRRKAREYHENNHTGPRKPVNLGNNALCMTHPRWCVRCLKEEGRATASTELYTRC